MQYVQYSFLSLMSSWLFLCFFSGFLEISWIFLGFLHKTGVWQYHHQTPILRCFHVLFCLFSKAICSLCKSSVKIAVIYSSTPQPFNNSRAVSSESTPWRFLIGANSFSRTTSYGMQSSIICTISSTNVSNL